MGKDLELCPYYGARNTISSSQIITLPYNMMLQKSTRESLGISLKDNIVIFGSFFLRKLFFNDVI
jgi:chromosome transmission fidelity protein 1